jgi:hypothetical protein
MQAYTHNYEFVKVIYFVYRRAYSPRKSKIIDEEFNSSSVPGEHEDMILHLVPKRDLLEPSRRNFSYVLIVK